eukprot:250166_1
MVNLKPQLKSEIHYGVVKTLCGGIYMVTYMLFSSNIGRTQKKVIIVVKWVDNLLGNVWRYVGIYVGIPVGIYEIDQEHLWVLMLGTYRVIICKGRSGKVVMMVAYNIKKR